MLDENPSDGACHPGHAVLRSIIPDTDLRRHLVRSMVNVRWDGPIDGKHIAAYFEITPKLASVPTPQECQAIADFINWI